MNRLIIKNFGPVKVLTICLDVFFYMRILKKEDSHIPFREFGIDE